MEPDITEAPFGQLPDGRAVSLYTLTNDHGVVIKVTNFGGIITHMLTPDRYGNMADIVHGFDELAPYLDASPYFGALIGRYGNRLRGGQFELDGTRFTLPQNDGSHHLHGGPGGFHAVLWNAQPFRTSEAVGLTLTYRSCDGEQGYPGNLDVTVVYALSAGNALEMTFSAITDRATPVNLTQHSYFNLAGDGDILQHELQIDADHFLPIDASAIPYGVLGAVEGTPFDFRQARPIGQLIDADDEQLRHGRGYDHTFVLRKGHGSAGKLAARLRDPESGRVLELVTQEPGVQFYSGNFLDGSLCGKGRHYPYRGGLCLEPQHFPDSPNQRAFPNTILRPGERYHTVSSYRFSVE